MIYEKMKKKHKLTSSMEDYLEAISVLGEEKGIVRVRDIGKVMKVKAPSVTGALKILSSKGLILHERYGYVDLTEEGKEMAGRIRKRHDTLIEFLTQVLGVDEKTAETDACRIEHAISPMTFMNLVKFVKEAAKGKKNRTRKADK
ncbi:MAG: metal-dependent transcriptional regulator [Candidatus Omnitrophica bacterium]|nr:metal-dependent transcriptional regulator [Candidatus Omnitrophota bacterium]